MASMAATMRQAARVLIGGTFACDAAIAQPLQHILDKHLGRVGGGAVAIEWLSYGSAADLSMLTEPLQRNYADVVILLVRVCDLQTAHPELQAQATTHSATPTSESQSTSGTTFSSQLQAYDQRNDASSPLPPLVVVFCASPPPPAPSYEQHEAELCVLIQSLQRVSCRPSSESLRMFASDDEDASSWYSALHDKREHAPFTQSMLNALALCCARQICRVFRQPHQQKKVIVLDCDNTLWGGAVADLGVHGVELSDRFLALQRFVVEQQKRGLLLCLCSKNIAVDVGAVFTERAADLVLQQADQITVSKVNWRNKSANIREIAQELSLGLDSFVFIDDNALECHEVASALPMLDVIQLPEDFDVHFLETQWVFDCPLQQQQSQQGIGSVVATTAATTEEDKDRTKMYQQHAQRQELQRHAPSQAAFLSSLGIRIQFDRALDPGSPTFARVLQLHKRTNTFNASTTFSRALTSESLAEYTAMATTHFVVAAMVTDRYGHYGLVCVALFRLAESKTTTVRVDSFIMSCRALNRGVEHAMVKKIAEITHEQLGADTVELAWEPTVRNEPARTFFASLSFTTFRSERGDASRPLVVTTRSEKMQQSSLANGVWRMATTDALAISFLKDGEQKQVVVPISWKAQCFATVYQLITRVATWMKKWLPPLPWLFRLVSWWVAVTKQQKQSQLADSPSTPQANFANDFHSRELLDDFVARHFVPQAATEEQQPSGDQVDLVVSDESFRLRARHETKLLLLDHVSLDTPRVIWAPNRSDDIRLDQDDDDDENDGSGSLDDPVSRPPVAEELQQLQQFHRPCATPSCSTKVFWESKCSFRCCRTCCYRVQRLLSRAANEQLHAKARAHASQSLRNDFNVTMDGIEAMDAWCGTHKNDNRRK